MDQVAEMARVESESSPQGVRDEFRAGSVIWIVELASRSVPPEVVGVLLGEEGALVVVEPPRHTIGGGVLEVHDDVRVAVESLFVEELVGAVVQTAETDIGSRSHVAPDVAREQGRGAGTVEATVVMQNPDAHAGG